MFQSVYFIFVYEWEIYQPFQFCQLFRVERTVKALHGHAEEYLPAVPYMPVLCLVIGAVDRVDVPAEMPELVLGEPEEQIPEFQVIGIALRAERNKTVCRLFQ